MNPIASEIVKAGEGIKAGSVILPVNNNPYWYLSHFSNYLGVDKPMIILENYEADNAYFPLRWKPEGHPAMQAELPCYTWRKTNHKVQAKPIDYVFILGDTATMEGYECNQALKILLSKQGKRTFKGEHIELYQIKSK